MNPRNISKEDIAYNLDRLNNLKCITPYSTNESRSYFDLNGTNIRLAYTINEWDLNQDYSSTYWFIKYPGYERLSFEEVLDSVPDYVQTELLFNLDLFR